MKEHALPQDITGYRFHIIGNMTLKQFLEVGAGCVVGFIIYNTNLPDIIKWPLIFLAAGAGAVAAFVPFEERPLDQWVVAFFRALYRPTQFHWRRKAAIPEPFLFQPSTETSHLVKEVDLTPVRRQRVKEYLHSIHTEEEEETDVFYAGRVDEVTSLFGAAPGASAVPSPIKTMPSPEPTLSTAATLPEQEEALPETPQEVAPTTLPEETVVPPTPVVTPTPSALTMNSPQDSSPIEWSPQPDTAPAPNVVFGATPAPAPANPTAPQVEIPELEKISLTPTYAEAVNQPTEAIVSPAAYVESTTEQTSPAPTTTQTAVQNADLPFPNRPNEPNKVVGMVLDQNNTPQPGVIVEILTPEGLPARAVKTNILGQFFVTTPLSNGTYIVQAEKEGLNFPVQELVLSGEVMDPIEVKST